MSDTSNSYEILKTIGSGGYGTVYLVRKFNKYYALKEIKGKGIKRELSGIKRYGALSKSSLFNETVVEISEINFSEDTLSYLMPLCDCLDEKYTDNPLSPSWSPKTLYNLICKKDEGKTWFSGNEIKAFLRPVFDATVFLSEQGILHRDIKPDNVLFFDGKTKLGDFGLSTQDRKSVSAMGTPDYLAPSWYLNSNGDADMWGLAATLYTLMTGFSPDTLGKAAYRYPKQNPEILSEEDKKLWQHWHRCIDRATHEKPSERFRNIADFRDAIFSEKLEIALPNTIEESKFNKNHLLIGAMLCVVLGISFCRTQDNSQENTTQVETPQITTIQQEKPSSTSSQIQVQKEIETQGDYVIETLPNGVKKLTNKQGIQTIIPVSSPDDKIFPKFFKNKICRNEKEYIETMILNGKNAKSDMEKIFKEGANPKDWGIKYYDYKIVSYKEHCDYWDKERKRCEETNKQLEKNNINRRCIINSIDGIEFCENQKNKKVYIGYLKKKYCDFIGILLYDRWIQKVMKSGLVADIKSHGSIIKDVEIKKLDLYKEDLKHKYLEAKKEWEDLKKSGFVEFNEYRKAPWGVDYVFDDRPQAQKKRDYLNAKKKYENAEFSYVDDHASFFKYNFLFYEVSKYTNNNN